MNPDNGAVYEMRESLVPETGQSFDMEETRRRLAMLDDATEQECAAALEQKLVAVGEQVAHRMHLAEREIERRRKRNKVARAARRRNR